MEIRRVAYVRTGYYKDSAMIEGSPITVCRRCGAAYSQVVMGACLECDRADWELCKLIDEEKFIFMPAKDPKVAANG